MKINQDWVKQKGTCECGAKWFNDNYSEDVEGSEVVETLMKDKTIKAITTEHDNATALSWANWLIVRLMTRKQYLQYAVFAAEQTIHIIERDCPDGKTARACIDAAKAVIEHDTEENRNKAAAAWDAARAAAWDAAARDAASDAAWDAPAGPSARTPKSSSARIRGNASWSSRKSRPAPAR